MQSAFANKPPQVHPITRKPINPLGIDLTDTTKRDQHQSMMLENPSTLLPSVQNMSVTDTPIFVMSPKDMQMVQQHAKQQSVVMSEPSLNSSNDDNPVPSSSHMDLSSRVAHVAAALGPSPKLRSKSKFSKSPPITQNQIYQQQVPKELTESQKQLLIDKRNNKRNFLPQIYNTANVSISHAQDRYKDQDLSTALFKQSIMAEFQTQNSSSVHQNTISVDVNQPTQHQQSTQMQTSQDQDSIISLQEQHLLTKRAQDYEDSSMVNESQDVVMLQDKGGNQHHKSYLAQQQHMSLMAIKGKQRQNMSTDLQITTAQKHQQQIAAVQMMKQSKTKKMQLVEAAMSSEVQDWVTDEIQDSSYRQTVDKIQEQAFRLNQQSTIITSQAESNALDARSLRDKISSRNSVQKKYQSSDIFALKQINAKQSRLDLLKKIGVTSAEQVNKRKERLLVQSVDLGNYADTTMKQIFNSTAKNKRLAASPMPTQQSQDFANKTQKKLTFNAASSGGSALKQASTVRSKKKNFLIAPQHPNQHIPSLGSTQNGDFMTQTLIGQMPTGSRLVQQQLQRTFDPLRKNTQRNIDMKSQSSLQESMHSKPNHYTKSFRLSSDDQQNQVALANASNQSPSSPHLLTQKDSLGNRKKQLLEHRGEDLQLDNILPPNRNESMPIINANIGQGVNNEYSVAVGSLAIMPPTATNKKMTEDLSPLLAQGYTTMQMAGGNNVSQGILMSQNPIHNDSMAKIAADFNDYRVTTGVGRKDASDGMSYGRQNILSKDEVTSDLYSQREIEVLRAKIEKRITLQHRLDKEDAIVRTTFEGDRPLKKGPDRLNMEKESRKTVLRMLQDNKQKLRQTRQEMIADIRRERRHQTEHNQSMSNIRSLQSSINLSTMKQLHPAPNMSTASQRYEQQQVSKSRHISNDPVLQTQVNQRLASGMPSLPQRDEMISQMEKITDYESQDRYHQRVQDKIAKKKRKDRIVSQSVDFKQNQSRFRITPGDSNMSLPSYITHVEKTQADIDREAKGRLWLYKIDQIEQEALCRMQDVEELHGLLKYKMQQYIKTKPKEEELHSLFHYQPKKVILTESQKEAAMQRKYHECAKKFQHENEPPTGPESGLFSEIVPTGGRRMTRKSMENLLAHLTYEQKKQIAANQPMYGEISYDRAINEIFDEREKQLADLNSDPVSEEDEEHKEVIKKYRDSIVDEIASLFDFRKEEEKKQKEKQKKIVLPLAENDTEQRKGMALMLRHEPNKSVEKESDEQLQANIQDFVMKLFSDLPAIENDYLTYYDAQRETPELSKTFENRASQSPNVHRKKPPLLSISNKIHFQKVHSAVPGVFSSTFSPIKRQNGLSRMSTLEQQQEVESKIIKNNRRKTTLKGMQKMAIDRENRQHMEQFPLKYLTEDTTEEFNQNQIATKIYELIHFYKAYKSSLSQVFLEKKSEDHRLGLILKCMEEMDVILPILQNVQPDGTLYLKEYKLDSGHANGLSLACQMNNEIFEKVFIDNCGLQEMDLAEMIEGFAILTSLKSLVIRRTQIGCDSIPYLAQAFVKMFPTNLLVLRVEKCQISKEATHDLCQAINEKCYLRTLSLVGVTFTVESIQILCQYLNRKSYLQDLDLSDNRLSPKMFMPLLETLSKTRQIKHLSIAWNLLLDNAKPPQIGTYVKEEKLIYGRANEPIDYPEPTPTVVDNVASDGVDESTQQPVRINSGAQNDKAQILPDLNLTTEHFINMSLPNSPNNGSNNENKFKDVQFEPNMTDGAAHLQNFTSGVKSPLTLQSQRDQTQPTILETEKQEKARIKVQTELSKQEEIVCGYLKGMCRSQTLMHLNLSDCGLTEPMLLDLSKHINQSIALLSVHLSGNPGLKDHVIRKIQGKLKATYEIPMLKQTFKPMIRDYNNKHGIVGAKMQQKNSPDLRRSILAGIEERDSLSSGSLNDYSEKNAQDPTKLKEQIAYKHLLREKEAMTQIDDGKMSRDMQRHFMIQRSLGNDIIIPGCSEWQISRQSQQECKICDRKQFTFFFWSPEFGDYDQSSVQWMTPEDQNKVLEQVFQNRETNNLAEARRMKLNPELNSPISKFKFDAKTNKIQELDSDDISQSIDSSLTISEGINKSEDNSDYDTEINSLTDSIGSSVQEKPQAGQKKKNFKLSRWGHLNKGPTISGSWNNWLPQPLIKVANLARHLDTRPRPDFLQQVKNKKMVRASITEIKDMTPRERGLYEEQVQAFENSYNEIDVWGPIIAKWLNTKFKSTRIVGKANIEEIFPKTVYVAAAYMDMGKHNYIVSTGSKTYFHETKVSFRRENLPIVKKFKKITQIVERNADVFKLWIKDTPERLATVYDSDFSHSKCGQILRHASQQEDMRAFMLQHYSWLKDVFMTLCVNAGSFPYLSSQEFSRFCQQIKMTNRTLKVSLIDVIITTVKARVVGVEHPKLPQQRSLDLSRAEFMEALIRLAILRYKEFSKNKAAVSIQDAVEKMFLENLRPYALTAPWQSFREEEIWTREVNLVFYDNQEGLKQLYQKYSKGGRVPMEHAIRLLTTDCPIRMDKYDAQYCYAMSLSTCMDLFKHTTNKLLNMTYEEFLEMIARAAELHFHGSDQDSSPLWEKIMHILNELFTLIGEVYPVQPMWTEEDYESESEPGTPTLGLQKLKQIQNEFF